MGDDLIHRAQHGDRDAVESLFRREWKPVYRLLYRTLGDRYEAEDLTQEVFIRALSALDRFQQTSTPSAKLPTEGAASKWAVDFASPEGGPPARVLQAQLMTLADAMSQDVDHGWVNAVPVGENLGTPVWVIEVDGAANPASCPPAARLACAKPVRLILVVNALTAQWIGWNWPHSGSATPTS